MAHVILVRKVDDGWVVGREGHDFQRFDSKASALERAKALIERLGDAELVVEDGAPGRSAPPREARPPLHAAARPPASEDEPSL